jgi:hypothetical protein
VGVVGGADQRGQDALRGGTVTGGQRVQGVVAPGGQASGDLSDALVGIVGEATVDTAFPQLGQGELERWQQGSRRTA